MATVTLVGRLLVSLAAVLAIMWLIGKRLRRTGIGKGNRLIDVLGRQQLSRTSSVAVVRVGDRALILGCSDTQVNVLGETDLAVAQALLATRSDSSGTGVAGRTAAAPQTATSHVAPQRGDTPRKSLQQRHALVGTGAGAVAGAAGGAHRTALTGSALSPATWKQTIESLRDLTAR